MANYQFTTDIRIDVLERAGEPTSSSSEFWADALTYINRAYKSIANGGGELIPEAAEDWWWLYGMGALLIERPNEQAVTFTLDSVNITFSNAPATSVAGWFVKSEEFGDVFEIATHTGGVSAATIDLAYPGTSGSKPAKLFKLDYTLAADLQKLTSPFVSTRGSVWDGSEISAVDLGAFQRDYPLGGIEKGVPTRFTHLTEQMVRFNRMGLDERRVRLDYTYKKIPSDLTAAENEEPLIPKQYRTVLADWALAHLLADKNETKAANAETLARRGLEAMIRENRLRGPRQSSQFGRLNYRQAGKGGPLRTEGGLIIG